MLAAKLGVTTSKPLPSSWLLGLLSMGSGEGFAREINQTVQFITEKLAMRNVAF
jgi:hypothetical protein